MRLKDRAAIVTGAASGIGRATAELFAGEGAQVLAVDVPASAIATTFEGVAGVVPLALFHGAPRFHQGGGFLTRTEFPAILEMGERVLTQRQQAAVGAAVADRSRPIIQNVTIQTPDAGSFRQSRGQVLAELSRSLARGNRHR